MMLYLYGQLALLSVFATALYRYAPRLALGGVLFGVTVPEGFAGTAPGLAIVARFRAQVLAAGAAGLAGIAALCAGGQVTAASVVVLGQVGLSTAAWVAARARTRPHAVAASGVRRAGLGAEPARWHPLLDTLPFLILAAGAVAVALTFDRLPERFPVHWGASGQPDRWVGRSAGEVFRPLVTGTLLVLMITAIRAVVLALAPRRAGDPRGQALRGFLRLGLLGASALLALVHASVALTPLAGGPAPVLVASSVGLAILLPVLAIATARLASLPSPGPGDGTPDDRWKLGGLFYVNPRDPAVFVPKRVGIGYTVNVGHTRGVLALLGLIVVPAAVVFLASLFAR